MFNNIVTKGMLLPFLFIASQAWAQDCSITGKIFNAINKEALNNATITVQGSDKGTTTDSTGAFMLEGLTPGLYNIEVRFTGFETYIDYELMASPIKPIYVEVGLLPSTYSLGEIVVSDEARTHAVVSPLALQKINWSELQRMPGTALDISKAIQSYPGVLPKSSFGYNIVVRGGAPNENVFYLDGIKIPAINHFSVQGASGGPNALINLDFIHSMDMYSGAFPANYQSGLSALLDIRQRDARADRIGGRATLGYSDLGLTLEGPIGQKSSFIASARTSFSQYLLKAFDLPVLPTYSDYQFRNKWRFDEKNELVITGIAGFDKYRLNTDAPESDALLYNVGYIPEGDQTVYAIGANYKHFLPNSFYSFVVSRNGFSNYADKFKDNTYLEEDRLLGYGSEESENHLRFEHNIYRGSYEFKYGLNYTQNNASFKVFGYDVTARGLDTVNFDNAISYGEYGGFAMLSRRLFNSRLGITAGLRFDGASYNEETGNPLEHISPRISANYALSEHFSLKSTAGIYYQLPPEILLAYNQGLADEAIFSDYMEVNQASLGFEYRNKKTYRASAEVYYKGYNNYPFLLNDSISYANAMADYVAVGNQPSSPTSVGRAYGMEIFIQQKLKRNYWWMMAYTYSKSEFQDKNGDYKPSSWDSRHFLTITAGKTLKRNWLVGLKWRYSDGTPYTPYDQETSANIANWEIANKGVFDYSRINAERLPAFHQLDIRIDKNWWYEKWNLNLFFDLQNAYRHAIQLTPYLTTERNTETWEPLIDQQNPENYLLKQINSDSGRTIYVIGIIAEF